MADEKHAGFSNKQFTEWREKLNKEIKRRGTFSWWDPLVLPTVGTDRKPRTILPTKREMPDETGSYVEHKVVSDQSYVVENPSTGAIEKTRNILYPSQGDNPGGQDTDGEYPAVDDNNPDSWNPDPGYGNPKTSATRFDQDEIRNYLLGLAKMHDIDLFHGRAEKAGVAFRDPADIGNKIEQATQDVLHEPVSSSIYTKDDPNAGVKNFCINGGPGTKISNELVEVTETDEDDNEVVRYKMPSGQYDGEEILPGHDGPDPTNFYDDYGAQVSEVNVSQLKKGTNTVTGPESGKVLAVHDAYKDPNFVATTTNSTKTTPAGSQPANGFVADQHASDIPMETLPGFKFKQTQSGGEDAMDPASPKYGGNHPNKKDDYADTITPLTKMKDNDPNLAFHPQNPYVSTESTVQQVEQDNYRKETVTEVTEGGKDSIRFGLNPRNPQRGSEYTQNSYRTVFSGKKGLCHVACSGLCYLTCDSECNESCQSTCWNRCGDACISTCSNVCTGCSSLCYNTCKTKCENRTGYSCIDVGAETIEVKTYGKQKGEWPKNVIKYKTHSCTGCSYSCQFYPNYRTSCTDAMCQNMCFYSCYSYCSTACYGGCINNVSEHDHSTVKDPGGNGDASPQNKVSKAKDENKSIDTSKTNATRYKTGKGQACKGSCTADCVGSCTDACVGTCNGKCFNSCTSSCYLTCNLTCSMTCGKACMSSCKENCTANCGEDNCKGGCSTSCAVGCADDCTGTEKIEPAATYAAKRKVTDLEKEGDR